MPTGTDQPFRSIVVPGLGGEDAVAIIVEHLAAAPKLEARRLRDGRLLVARTHRPRGAVIACIATIWLGGLGLLFLLLRRTESAEISIRETPRGCTITIPPLIDTTTAIELERLLRPERAEPDDDHEFPVAGDLDAPTTRR